MDILYDIIDREVIDRRKYKYLIVDKHSSWSEVFVYQRGEKKPSEQYKKIISIVEEYDGEIQKFDMTNDDYPKQVMFRFEKCLDKLKNLTISKVTMSALIRYASIPNGGIRDRLLTVLYDKAPENFLKCFKLDPKVDPIHE